MNNENKCKSEYNKGISCDVKNCMYHCGEQYCTANKIAVGPSSASTSADTVCATFKPKAE